VISMARTHRPYQHWEGHFCLLGTRKLEDTRTYQFSGVGLATSIKHESRGSILSCFRQGNRSHYRSSDVTKKEPQTCICSLNLDVENKTSSLMHHNAGSLPLPTKMMGRKKKHPKMPRRLGPSESRNEWVKMNIYT
jgi:hypothetical protein